MDYNRNNMSAINVGFNKTFSDAFALKSAEVSAKLGPIVTEIASTTEATEFPFLEQFAGMREWIGPRQVQNISSKKLRIENKKYEQTLGMPRTSIEDDTYGLYSSNIAQIGASAANMKSQVVFDALVGNANWLDGSPFYGTTRKYGKNTILNYVAGALTESTFNAAYLTMTSYKGHGGPCMRVKPTHLVVGPKNRIVAWNIIKNQFAYDATAKVQIQNVNLNLVDMIELSDLVGDYDDYWFLVAGGEPVKPLIVSNRKSPTLIVKDRAEYDDNVFMEDVILYGTDARFGAALAVPHLIYAGIV